MALDSGSLWYVKELPGLELLAGHYRRQVFPWHSHDAYCISLQERGTETVAFADRPWQVRPGAVLVINPGEVHTNYGLLQQEWQFRSFYVPSTLLQAVAEAGTGLPYFPQRLLNNPPLFQQLQLVHQQLTREGHSVRARLGLEAGLAALVRNYARPVPSKEAKPALTQLRQMLAVLDHQLPAKVAVADLAAEAQLSRFQFTRQFVRATGLTPTAYLLQKRIAQAKLLLRTGATPVTAAFEVGFFDQSHLTRHFKRVVGVTPGQYRDLACTIVQDYHH